MKLYLGFILSAVLCVLVALIFSAEQLASFFNPKLLSVSPDLILSGVNTLQFLLIIDAIIFVCLALVYFKQWLRLPSNFEPMWQPSTTSYTPLPLYRLYIGLILVLAAILRFVHLDNDLWMDEVYTLVGSVRLSLGEIFSSYLDDNQHSLYSLLAKISINTLGESSLALRLPAALFGVASIWAVARLAKLVFGDRVAIWSALILTFTYHHIWFSQNARGYTLLLFATVLGTDFLLRGLKTGEWKYWLGYSLTIAVGAWAHLTGVFIGLAHGLVLLMVLLWQWRLDGARWRILVAFLLSAWFTLHCYSLVIPQIYSFFVDAATVNVNTAWTSPLWLLNEVLSRLGIPVALGWVGLLAITPIGLLVLLWLSRRDCLFIALGIAPGLLIGIVMMALGRNLWPRMFFNEAGFVVIVLVVMALGAGEFVVDRYVKNASKLRYALLSVLLILAIASLPALYRYPKQDYTGARDFVLSQLGAGDHVLGLHMAGRVYNLYYAPEWPEITSLEEFNKKKNPDGVTWVLYTLPGFIDSAMPELAEALAAEFEVVREFPGTLGDGEIIVARSKILTK